MSTIENRLKKTVDTLQSIRKSLEHLRTSGGVPASANKLRVLALREAHEVAGALLNEKDAGSPRKL